MVPAAGYRPGLAGRLIELHALYYSRRAGFGAAFEAKVASGLAEFVGRLERPANEIWHATASSRVVAAIAIDGEGLADGSAHLRWFIVEDGYRGQGVGRSLLAAALDFADRRGFACTQLWTFEGLDAARGLYERSGFVLADAWLGTQWGREVREQRFVRQRPQG